jgi:hypothetical protein
MIVCDRHPRTRATGRVILERDDERFDLCQDCLYQIKEFIGNASLKEVEPKRRKERFGVAG